MAALAGARLRYVTTRAQFTKYSMKHDLDKQIIETWPDQMREKFWTPLIMALLKKHYIGFLLAGALSNLAVFAVRFISVFEQHGLQPTSGSEGEGAFGIYRACTNQPIYHDFSQVPNPALYNFLFYNVYGYLIRFFSSCDATPLIGRFITLSLLVIAAGLIWFAGRAAFGKVEAGVLALALFSPTIGWWAFALRPDVGGMTFLTAALLCFVYYLNNPRLWILLLSGVCLIGAWGFKQPFAFAAPVMLGYTFIHNRNHSIALLLLLVLGFCAPLLMYTPTLYLLHTVTLPSSNPFDQFVALRNAVTFFSKSFGVLIPATLIGWIALRSEPLRSGTNFLFSTFVISFALSTILAGYLGASDNNFFPTFVAGTLVIAVGSSQVHKSARRLSLLILSLVTLIQSGLLLTGIRGKLDLPEDTTRVAPVLSAALVEMPGPKLVWHPSLGLPWNTPGVETRILDSNDDLAAAPRIPGAIDLKSLLASGFYGSVAIPAGARGLIDPSKYRLKAQIGPLLIFARME